MNIVIKQSGDFITVVLSGRFTFSDHTAFRNVLTDQMEQLVQGGKVTFDLAEVEFVDSAALGMLLLARETAQRRLGSVVLRGATGQVRRMLDVSKFDMLFSVEA